MYSTIQTWKGLAIHFPTSSSFINWWLVNTHITGAVTWHPWLQMEGTLWNVWASKELESVRFVKKWISYNINDLLTIESVDSVNILVMQNSYCTKD